MSPTVSPFPPVSVVVSVVAAVVLRGRRGPRADGQDEQDDRPERDDGGDDALHGTPPWNGWMCVSPRGPGGASRRGCVRSWRSARPGSRGEALAGRIEGHGSGGAPLQSGGSNGADGRSSSSA